jgi:outer membrane protein
MHRYLWLLLLALAFPAGAAEVKVGFVDVPSILDKAPQAEEARSRIEGEFAPRDRDLLAQQKELRTLEDQLIRDREIMAATERARVEREIRTMKREIRRAQEEFRDDLNLRRNQELGKLQQKVLDVIRDVAKGQNYDLIISEGVLFAGDRIDITDKVLSALQQEFDRKK